MRVQCVSERMPTFNMSLYVDHESDGQHFLELYLGSFDKIARFIVERDVVVVDEMRGKVAVEPVVDFQDEHVLPVHVDVLWFFR